MELGFSTEEAVSTEISLHNPQNCTLLCFLLHDEYSLILWNCRFLGAYQWCSVIQKSLDESLTPQRPFSSHTKYRST